jgi:hypothetical protein
MKSALAVILVAAAGGIAAAQPQTEPVGGMGADPPVTTTTPPADTPPQPPHPPQPVVRSGGEHEHGDEDASSTGRPEGIAFGIGFGYTFPTSWQMPNTTSVRIRFGSGLTLEPIVVLGNESTKQESGGVSAKDSTTQLDLGALVRIPVVRHRKVELEVLAGAGLGTTKSNPDGDDNNTTTTNLNLNWGLAVSYWFTQHWNLSFSARNPLISVLKSTREMAAGDAETTTTSIQAAFAPVVQVMLHLYD